MKHFLSTEIVNSYLGLRAQFYW